MIIITFKYYYELIDNIIKEIFEIIQISVFVYHEIFNF